MTRSRFIGLVVALATALLASWASATDGVREKDVFQRLFAPCCYRETLDVHVSPIAEELRLEIRARLGRGEAADAIVADMARRYGDEVLVRPPGRGLSLALFGGAGLLASGLVATALGSLAAPGGARRRLARRQSSTRKIRCCATPWRTSSPPSTEARRRAVVQDGRVGRPRR